MQNFKAISFSLTFFYNHYTVFWDSPRIKDVESIFGPGSTDFDFPGFKLDKRYVKANIFWFSRVDDRIS